MKREIKRKEYMYNFEEGGWNTVWAKSLPGARKKAALEYKGREMLVPNLSTVALCNDRVLANAMSTFY